ncbi:MAG TPA: Mrp/NBP35 family ATP-binding protein [Candidatus Polarisedimenticolaceae bacterium]
MPLEANDVLAALSRVRYPGFTRDIVSFGVVKDLRVEGGDVAFRVELGPGNPAVAAAIERDARAAVESLPGVRSIAIRVGGSAAPVAAGAPLPMAGIGAPGAAPSGPAAGLDPALVPGVRHLVAVASGKGGVGKSTVAVNLAVALAKRGARVGLVDADIYGPSIPLMMGVDERPALDASGSRLVPFERFGVRFMSIGFLVEKDQAVIWRGPMVMKAVEQLLRDVAWGELDVLIVDMPPGTGDAQLTLSQKVRLAGAVVVTTPQDVALADATKGVAMFRKVGVPVLGIVENMSFFTCPHCGERSEIFGHGGGREEARRLGVPFLGEIELDPAIRDGGDAGRPIVEASPESPRTAAFLSIADHVLQAIGAEASPSPKPGVLGWIQKWTGGGAEGR